MERGTSTLVGSVSECSRCARLLPIPPIETYPKLVTLAQTSIGKLVIVGLFSLGFGKFMSGIWERLLMAVILVLITFLPKWRRTLVAAGTIAVSAMQTRSPQFLAVVVLGILVFWCARRWPQSRFGKSPVAFLLVSYSLFILAVCRIPKASGLFTPAWNTVKLVSSYIWFVGYALMDRAAQPSDDLAIEVGAFRPFWGSSNVPFPKGAAYLRRIEATNAEQLAITQLKGLKLLGWALMLNILLRWWKLGFHTYLHIPLASEALAMSVRRTPFPWYVCWESQVLSFFESLLDLSVFGHRMIACCRVAGFNALRNTYRPLTSRTIVEFFNRYYYYFKELLVDFFFYPTFFRCFKRHRRLRLAMATFAAAGLGNLFYHFTRDSWMIQNVGLARDLISFQVYAFYCLLLATGLSISQLRRHHPLHPGFIRGRVLPAVWVVLFYCLLDVFGSTERNYPLAKHFRFLAHLLGI